MTILKRLARLHPLMALIAALGSLAAAINFFANRLSTESNYLLLTYGPASYRQQYVRTLPLWAS